MSEKDDLQDRLYRIIDGTMRDVLFAHPDYLTEKGRERFPRSFAKRLSGTLFSLAKAEGRGDASEPPPPVDIER